MAETKYSGPERRREENAALRASVSARLIAALRLREIERAEKEAEEKAKEEKQKKTKKLLQLY
jgi:hypothetical protein